MPCGVLLASLTSSAQNTTRRDSHTPIENDKII
jgi:hypothetical protein